MVCQSSEYAGDTLAGADTRRSLRELATAVVKYHTVGVVIFNSRSCCEVQLRFATVRWQIEGVLAESMRYLHQHCEFDDVAIHNAGDAILTSALSLRSLPFHHDAYFFRLAC